MSVGFPIPSSNFTATLEPRNEGASDLVLTSRSDLPFPGHYLSSVDSERDALTVIKLLSFEERIHVFVRDGELRTDHSFSLAGVRFLTLHYEYRAARPHSVLMSPPSMTKFEPLTLAVRGEASSGHERGDLPRRREAARGDARDRLLADAVRGDPRGARRWSRRRRRRRATGRSSTWPGETLAMRMPCGRELLGQRLGHVEQRRLGRAVVDDRAVGLEEGVDGGDVDDRAAAAGIIAATAARVARSAEKKFSSSAASKSASRTAAGSRRGAVARRRRC